LVGRFTNRFGINHDGDGDACLLLAAGNILSKNESSPGERIAMYT
jgi:hypothetical protein